jgi:hypothetical protein
LVNQEFDVTLKDCLQHLTAEGCRQLTGAVVERWLDVDLADVRRLQPDLLGETTAGDLLHIELQNSNDPDMPLRMVDHSIAIFRRLARWPKQVVLYFGDPPVGMPSGYRRFEWQVVDAHALDGEPLLASAQVDDNVVAVLLRLRDERATLHRILERVGRAPSEQRQQALKALFVLARLRGLAPLLEEEAKKMPIDFEVDWKTDEYFGPIIARAAEEAVAKRVNMERQVLRRLIEKRFGELPAWATERIDATSGWNIEQLTLRVLDAGSVAELLG